MAEKPEGKPSIEERVAELKAEGKKEDEIKLILFEEYPDGEVMKSGFLKKEEKPPKEIPISPEEKASFEERLEELKASEMNKHDICRTLALENYNPSLLMTQFGGLYRKVANEIKAERAKDEDSHIAAMAGITKGEGYLAEQKDFIRFEFSRNTVVMKFVVDLGYAVFLAALSKTGVPPEDLLKNPDDLLKALTPLREMVFKAIQYYDSDKINKVEGERDEARAYSSYLAAQWEDIAKQLDPKFRLEKMINTYLFSGSADTDLLLSLIDKWLSIEMGAIRLELMK